MQSTIPVKRPTAATRLASSQKRNEARATRRTEKKAASLAAAQALENEKRAAEEAEAARQAPIKQGRPRRHARPLEMRSMLRANSGASALSTAVIDGIRESRICAGICRAR